MNDEQFMKRIRDINSQSDSIELEKDQTHNQSNIIGMKFSEEF